MSLTFSVGCLAAAVNGGIQPLAGILFAEIIAVFADPGFTDSQQGEVINYSLYFVAIAITAFLSAIVQVSARESC